MFFPNAKGSEVIAFPVADAFDISTASGGSVSTGWLDASKVDRVLAHVRVGAMAGGSTVDAKLEQATSSGGAGVKDVAGKAITQLLAAGGNNRRALIDLRTEELDVNNNFTFVRLTITVGGGANSTVGGSLIGLGCRYGPAQGLKAASIAEIV